MVIGDERSKTRREKHKTRKRKRASSVSRKWSALFGKEIFCLAIKKAVFI
jgi:hypothetical protein